MKVVQLIRDTKQEWSGDFEKVKSFKNPLVFVFGERVALESHDLYKEIESFFTDANIILGSTAGEIFDYRFCDDTITVTAIEFEKTKYIVETKNILDFDRDSFQAGMFLMKELPKVNLKHVFVLSEGSFVDASSLISGLEKGRQDSYAITGGLCGDGVRFQKTFVGYNEIPKEGEIVAIGFYGDDIEVSYASVGGWTPFGPEREVTKSVKNVIHEIDGVPALDLYKKFLGDKASQLPGISLAFPVEIKMPNKKAPLVRTVFGINEEEKSISLAGDVPEGSKMQLVMSYTDAIIQGAYTAAELAMENRTKKPDLALIVSCVGRRIAMKERCEEEIEVFEEIFDENTILTGFYSYGEMAPFAGDLQCELHNQTMTLTLISE